MGNNSLKLRATFDKTTLSINKKFENSITVNAFRVKNNFEETEKIFEALEKRLYKEGEELSSKEVFSELKKFYNRNETPTDHLIMFSGGYDSLSLALRYLEKGESVMLFSLVFDPSMLPFIALQSIILDYLYPNLVSGTHILGGEQYTSTLEHFNGMVQQPFTAFMAGRIKNELLENAKTFDCAYCMNDDALSFEEELITIYENHIRSRIYGPSKFPKLTFPLKKTKHFDNVKFVKSIEEKRNVIFPVQSLESIDLVIRFYYVNNSLYMMMRKNCNFEIHKENKEGGFSFGGYVFRIDNLNFVEEDDFHKLGLISYFDNTQKEENKKRAFNLIKDIRKYSLLSSDEISDALKKGEKESKNFKELLGSVATITVEEK